MFNISTVRAGILAFYVITGFFAFIEHLNPAACEGFVLWFGRFAGALVGFGLVVQGLSELRPGEINAELEGRPEEPVWRVLNKIFFFYGLLMGPYRVYQGEVWDGLLLLCYPAWHGLLRLELRHRAIDDGSRRLPTPAYWLLWASALTLLVSFFLMMVLPQGGPKFVYGDSYYRLFPFLSLVALPFVIIGALITGGRVLPRD